VSCPASIGWLYADEFPNLAAEQLTALCTTECWDSLQTHRQNLTTSCDPDVEYFDEPTNTYWALTAFDDRALENYNLTCLTRSDGQLCNTWFQQNSTVASGECDDCMIETLRLQAGSSWEADVPVWGELYTSAARSCSKQVLPIPTPASTALLTSTVAPAFTCTGTSYQIQPTDTFYSVPEAQNVATEQFLNVNSLTYNASAFPQSGTVCIQNACAVHVVQANQTCRDIEATAGVSLAQLTAWNPVIEGLCADLSELAGQTVCVSNPLGDYRLPNSTATEVVTTPVPAPTDIAPNVTARCARFYDVAAGDDCSTITAKFSILLEDFLFLNPSVNENCTNLWLNYSYCIQPVGDITTYPGYGGTTTTTLPPFTPGPKTALPWDETMETGTNRTDLVVIPLAEGTRIDCYYYIWINVTDTEASNLTCWDVASWAGQTPEQFALWNPSIDQNTNASTSPTYDYDCTLTPSVSYCALLASPTPVTSTTATPKSPRASGEAESCIDWAQVDEYTDCAALLANSRISLARFYELNPSAKSDCSGLALGTWYCIDTPDDHAGTLTEPRTVTATATSSGTASPTSTVTPPGPTQSGIPSDCNEYVMQQDGVYCYDMAVAAGISLDELYAWNPALNGDCSGLWAGYAYCVGRAGSASSSPTPTPTTASPTPTPTSTGVTPPGPTQAGIPATCNKYVMQRDGVYCYDMAAEAGITLDQLYQWNPALNGDCSGLWAGYAYCTGVSG